MKKYKKDILTILSLVLLFFIGIELGDCLSYFFAPSLFRIDLNIFEYKAELDYFIAQGIFNLAKIVAYCRFFVLTTFYILFFIFYLRKLK